MKRAFCVFLTLLLVAAMLALPAAAETEAGGPLTVYVSVSANGVLEIAAQPVTIETATVEAALLEAHRLYHPNGTEAFQAGIDPSYNMYMINTAWGVATVPYIVKNGAPLGAGDNQAYISADVCPLENGDNLILVADAAGAVPACSLERSEDGTVTLNKWMLDFATFQYTSMPVEYAELVDAESGKLLGKTDAKGQAALSEEPASGVVAYPGAAALRLDGGDSAFTCVKTPYAEPVRDLTGVEMITVYATVYDNGGLANGEVSGTPLAAYPVSVPKGAVVDDVLRALHAAECAGGESGYKSDSMMMYGQNTSFMSKWFGKPVDNMTDGSKYAVSAWLNCNTNSTLQSKVREGDRVDVNIYSIISAMNFQYEYMGTSWFDYYAVEAGVGESFSVGAWSNVMDMTTFMMAPQPCPDMNITVNGLASDFRVGADGGVALRFDEAGVYYVMATGNPAYAPAAMKVTVAEGASFTGYTQAGPGRLAASGLEEGGDGKGDITVYVSASDNNGYLQGEVSGAYLVAYPLTLPSGATLDDALDALNKAEFQAGAEGYASSKMEMGGMASYLINRCFGEATDMESGNTNVVGAFVNHDSTTTLATPLQDGDFVDIMRYTVVDATMFTFENYGLCFFDYPSASAGIGESVPLHVYTETMNFMTFQYQTQPAGNLSVFVNGEASEFAVDANGAVTLRFDEPGEYNILAGGDKTHAAAVMKLTVAEGAAFSDSSASVDAGELLASSLAAPGNGSGPDITVYVTVTDKGDYFKSEASGEYLIACPVTVPGGSTVDDVLQALHVKEYSGGAFGYSSYSMSFGFGDPFYSIGTWFGKPVNTFDGSDYALTAWLNRDTTSTLASKVSDGDVVDVIVYGVVSTMEGKYSHFGAAYFDYAQLKAGVGEAVTLHAYHAVMNAETFTWSNFVSQNLEVYVNGEKRSETVGADGSLTLSFDAPGTYYVLAPGDGTFAAAAVKVVVEEGARFADSVAMNVPDAETPVVIRKLDSKILVTVLIVAVVLIIVVIAVVRIVKNKGKKEDGEE